MWSMCPQRKLFDTGDSTGQHRFEGAIDNLVQQSFGTRMISTDGREDTDLY